MTLADVYLFCFAFGFFFSFVAAVTGHLHVGFDGHHFGHFDAAHGGHADSGHAAHGDGPPILNMGTIAAFLAWFGGTGYLATRFYRMWFLATLLWAVVAGVAGAWIVYLFLAKVLMRQREALDPADYDMVGVLGSVSGTIRANGLGEILYSREGSRHAAPARSEDGTAIPNGVEVVVTRYENGVAYVRRWDELTEAK